MVLNDISKKAGEYLDSAVELLSGLISYKSVMGKAEKDAPYGRECADVLAFAQDVLEKDGFYVKNFDNHAITAAFDERPAELGILCHLDVVPVEGQEWSSDPFKAEIRDGRVYGRGAIDDKGPAAAVITAMRMIRDSGIKLGRNVRLILGSNEENGSEDMEYYVKKEKFPPMLFTPDGSFPIINIEKGMIRFKFSGNYSGGNILSIKGGSVVNAVPERAEAVVRGVSAEEIKASARNMDGILLSVENNDDNTVCIKVKGKGAHASTPEQGVNALTALLSLLGNMEFTADESNELYRAVRTLNGMFPFGEYDGKVAGVKCFDEKSGALTLVLSVADCGEDSYSFMCDCRFPVCRCSEDITKVILRRMAENAVGCEVMLKSEPHSVDEDSEMIKTLLDVYEDCTGEKGRCLAIGGGTYVHDTDNGVAFGAEWSDENNMHGADEFIGLDELKKDIEIYTEAILRLCM